MKEINFIGLRETIAILYISLRDIDELDYFTFDDFLMEIDIVLNRDPKSTGRFISNSRNIEYWLYR